ncbi:unnamed protein product [Prorocentrum cordatum]|uniref:Aminoglycoside phosphotransferase domain-containing protein n=1 Tax=Prorocentrum cordatum TaxID=2364126 RepID=A0ABN9TM56_9DINO|nr:unnamed protein product [Polarella glacialis]
MEGCVALRDAAACERAGRLDQAARHFRRAYRLWPELDSAMHSDGVPAALRREADALARPLDEEEEWRLARACWPALQGLGLADGELAAVSSRCLQRLWTGLGYVVRLSLSGTEGSECSAIAKVVRLPDEAEDWHRRDLDSYGVEAAFYERGLAQRLQLTGAACPTGLHVERGDGGRLTICMTEAPGTHARRLSRAQALAALSWLARLHASCWGPAAAAAAVAAGLHAQGCYWRLGRPGDDPGGREAPEPAGLRSRLRLASPGLDARLRADHLHTVCHGDAKGANMLFDEGGGVAFVDFQWACQASAAKDLAYCLTCGYPEDLEDGEEEYLGHYHRELAALLRADAVRPGLQQVRDSYQLACCDLARFQCTAGWWGNAQALRARAAAVLDRVDGGSPLPSEEAYRDAIFGAFPV